VGIVEKTIFQRWFNSSTPSETQESVETLAERGSADAQFSLGLKCASGKGSAQDYAQAEHWYLKAAEQNHALAHLNLGVMYANGQGQPPDPAKSLLWMQKAADLGDASAQFRLGELSHRAVRVGVAPVDGRARIDAYKWYRLAADQGYQGAQTACESVNVHMSREDVVEAIRRVAVFNAESDRRTPHGE
jgi:hypothetical protein